MTVEVVSLSLSRNGEREGKAEGRLSSSYTRWKWVTSSLTAFRGVTSPVQLGGPEDQTYQHIRTMVEQFSSAVTEE